MSNTALAAKDFASENEIRWCPGCGDYSILKQLQMTLAKTGSVPHKTAIISGIGCSSRLPYYMKTYGFHTIHGRSFPIATGLKLVNPELEVWIVTGDGDSLSIGTNHFVHLFRKNIDVNILLFNNRIYGLTKGQYSPTSEIGQKSKSTPFGVKERNLNALELALASQATFVARTLDREASHMQFVFSEAKAHAGSSLVEILQNCPIFNDAIFENYTNKQSQPEHILFLEEGKPLLFGKEMEKAIVLENFTPKIVDAVQVTDTNVWIHEPNNRQKAILLSQFGYHEYAHFPLAIGVIHNQNLFEKMNENDTKIQYYKASEVIFKNIFEII